MKYAEHVNVLWASVKDYSVLRTLVGGRNLLL